MNFSNCGSVKVHWLAWQPTPYNDFLFQKLSEGGQIDLTVHYREPVFPTHPWKTRFGRGYKWRCYKCFWGIDWEIISLVFTEENNFFIIAGWNHATTVLLLNLLILLGRRYAIWTDTPDLNRKRNRLFALARSVWLNLVLKRSCTVLGMGMPAVEALKLMGAPENKLVVFPVWVDLERIDSVKRHSQQIDTKEKILFVSLGVLKNSLKGHDVAIRSLALAMERKGIEFEYLIAGSGADHESLQLLATEIGVGNRVRLMGWLEPEQIIDLLVGCDVLIHPSPTHEPYGVAVIEAMAAGCIVLASDVTCAAIDRIQHGENGFIHRAGNVENLAEQIEWLYANREKLPMIKSKAHETAQKWPVDKGISLINHMVAL